MSKSLKETPCRDNRGREKDILTQAVQIIMFLLIFSIFSILPIACTAGAEEATVRATKLDMHTDSTDESVVVKSLVRGNTVNIDYEVAGRDGSKWCFVLEKGSFGMGYVRCDALSRSPRAVSGGATQDTDNSGVKVALYMTDW